MRCCWFCRWDTAPDKWPLLLSIISFRRTLAQQRGQVACTARPRENGSGNSFNRVGAATPFVQPYLNGRCHTFCPTLPQWELPHLLSNPTSMGAATPFVQPYLNGRCHTFCPTLPQWALPHLLSNLTSVGAATPFVQPYLSGRCHTFCPTLPQWAELASLFWLHINSADCHLPCVENHSRGKSHYEAELATLYEVKLTRRSNSLRGQTHYEVKLTVGSNPLWCQTH